MTCDSGPFRHSEPDVSAGRRDSGRPGLALVVLSVVEQRLDAVRAVLAGSDVMEVAASLKVHRSTVHRWVGRYLTEHLAGWLTGRIGHTRVPLRWRRRLRSRWRRRAWSIQVRVAADPGWRCCASPARGWSRTWWCRRSGRSIGFCSGRVCGGSDQPARPRAGETPTRSPTSRITRA
ncbi:helix-turn-helix domain-containing protein [Micromonospora echinofusca]|uniref:helix-turn-helix domain-containing protein n=1 Tax=Micromonospora echinofusca TaxID=47858 RepID=UPI00342CEE38